MVIQEKKGKTIVREVLDWDGKVIPNLHVSDPGRFFIKYDERGPGVVVEFIPTINNRCAAISANDAVPVQI